YGWKQAAHFEDVQRAYDEAQKDGAGRLAATRPRAAAELENEVKRVLAGLDRQDRWISTYRGERLVGQPKFAERFRYLASEVLARKVELLAEYLKASRP